MSDITPELLLQAYANGVFPMADSADSDEIYWVDPTDRGIFPINGFHISRSLRRALRRDDYSIHVDANFGQTVMNCAKRDETWINAEIFALYNQLHGLGFAHSVEVWRADQMIGGVYGVALGSAFFGESMFSAATNGSKIALAYLTHRLAAGGFQLFDTQFITPHLASLGAIEIPRAAYHDMLFPAVTAEANFTDPITPSPAILIAQT
ncbi:leucyl/phenylalanyl-tRNA--protein transferase [Amylibacter sp. IMCC11727]|uniref:leucyl/phenylalanyl-tRNA--protein transferase n=1 Tax=Amylibacter sp. IMCC11727 TaxID=3039851 RepID=UPI00244DFB32|nr:leucyl/phenylalanyl-tRNA--protein transferase [Amylibacter sp. IMCC11727]WGI20587.1 leucyl/phenylalanyl-tRNA--protein transferase [Amylibacter sp. IMCC11727]